MACDASAYPIRRLISSQLVLASGKDAFLLLG